MARMATIVGLVSVLAFMSAHVYGPVMAQEEITIGATLGMTGPPPIARASIPLDIALKDCIALANQEGGVNGKKIRYIMKDDRYKANVGVEVFKEMMAKYAPLCMYGSGTPVALAVAPLLRSEFPLLYSSTSFSAKLAYSGVPSLFVSGPTYGDQFAVALKYIAGQKKGARVAFFYSKGPLGEDPIPYGRILSRRLRLNLVGEVVGDIRGGDHSSQIEVLKRKKPDYVIMHGWVGPPNADLIKQCRSKGLQSTIVLTIWGAVKSVVEALGPDAESFLCVSPYAYWWMEDVPMIKTIKAYTAKQYPDVSYRTLNYIVPFVTGRIFVECLRRADSAGELNSKGLIKALKSLKDFDTGGLTPPLTIRNNRFPVARILKSNSAKGILEPVTDWITFY